MKRREFIRLVGGAADAEGCLPRYKTPRQDL